MDMTTIEGIYNVLTMAKPDNVFALRVWEGLANTFYYRALDDPMNDYKVKLAKIMELADEYEVSIPSAQMQAALKHMKLAVEANGNTELETKMDLEYEFSRITGSQSSENI